MSGKKYVEVGAVLEFADVFFADPILRAATRAILAAAPAAAPIAERETRGTEKDCLTKMLMESPSLCTLYGTRESYAENADWLLDEGVAVPVRCKDCAHNGLFDCPLCYIEKQTLQFIEVSPDFYCGQGERRPL